MLGSTASVVLALLLSVSQTGLGEAAPAVQASADESARDGVRTEWETRAHARGRLADLIGPLRAVEAPAWEPTTSLRNLAGIDAESRAARLRGGVSAVARVSEERLMATTRPPWVEVGQRVPSCRKPHQATAGTGASCRPPAR